METVLAERKVHIIHVLNVPGCSQALLNVLGNGECEGIVEPKSRFIALTENPVACKSLLWRFIYAHDHSSAGIWAWK
jgi:hypothetical protein